MNKQDKNSPPAAETWLEKWKDGAEIAFKIAGTAVAVYGAWWASDLKDKLSAASLLVQREQAETNLRATMFNNLMERIVTKDPKTKEDPEKMLLLAEMLALNFDEHFQFKPMLVDLQKQLKNQNKLLELESVSRRIVDRQIDMLRAAMRTQGDEYRQDHGVVQDVFTSDLFFKKYRKEEKKGDFTISYECNYIDLDSFKILDKSGILGNVPAEDVKKWFNTQQQPALFIDEKFSRKTDEGCDLHLNVASDSNPENEIIRKFEMDFESKRKECAVLIVRAASNPEKWTIAGFNDAEDFHSDVINDLTLLKELKNQSINKSRIVELATLSLGRTPEKPSYDEGFSQCVTVVSPDLRTSPEAGYSLDIAVLKYNPAPDDKTVTVSVNVTGEQLKGISMVYEFDVTPFDFPLTDNTAIDSDHRFAIVQRNITDDEIWLRLIWFPKGYITEKERPINYAEIRELLKANKRK